MESSELRHGPSLTHWRTKVQPANYPSNCQRPSYETAAGLVCCGCYGVFKRAAASRLRSVVQLGGEQCAACDTTVSESVKALICAVRAGRSGAPEWWASDVELCSCQKAVMRLVFAPVCLALLISRCSGLRLRHQLFALPGGRSNLLVLLAHSHALSRPSGDAVSITAKYVGTRL
jgi:hypothetical protein